MAMLMHLRCQASYSPDGRDVGAGSAVDGVHVLTVMNPDMCSSLHVCQSILAPGMTAADHLHTRNTKRNSETIAGNIAILPNTVFLTFSTNNKHRQDKRNSKKKLVIMRRLSVQRR